MKSHVVDFRPQYLVTSYRYEPENKPKENLHISNNAISFILLTCKKQLHKRKKYAFTLLFTIFGVKFLFFKKIKIKKKSVNRIGEFERINFFKMQLFAFQIKI